MTELRSQDTVSADLRFLGIASGCLTLLGLLFLALGLTCKVADWGYCQMELFPLFGGDYRFPEDITLLNLPMAMIVIGIGIRLKSPYGWWVITIILMSLLALLGFMLSFHWGNWPLMEESAGLWKRVPLSSFPQADAFLTCLLSLLLVLAGFFYWISYPIRHAYFRSIMPVDSRDSSPRLPHS